MISDNKSTAFKLIVLGTNWGFNGTVDEFCAAAKKEGYDGIEMWWPNEPKAQDELFNALKKHNLEVGFLCGGHSPNPEENFNAFKKAIDASTTNKIQRPLYINCHSGKDFFSFEQNKKFIDYTTGQSKTTGITICHETHRGRILYAAPVAKQFIDSIPDLKITFDVSHWCNVHESLLDDQKETVQLALQRVEHIHARIGHSEGPQVNDPRAPEWNDALQHHLAWWDVVVERKRQRNQPATFLTEFGPVDYLPALPYTRRPVADQWAINVHMMQLLRKRYS